MLKFTIQNDQFSFSVDYSFHDKVEGGVIEEYFPEPKEAIEDFLRLLWNIYSPEKISDALSSGLDAMEYSKKGYQAEDLLRKQEK